MTCTTCGQVYPDNAGECPRCWSPTIDLTSPRTSIIVVIPGYRIRQLLGKGGMGYVFLAEEETLKRRVAIKIISHELASDKEACSRFLKEARIMATLEHPHIVRLYAFGETQGKPYLVMEYVDGEALSSRIKRLGKLDAPEALAILRQVVEALEAAWENQIVHRDIKPHNILIDHRNKVHVADFGLAKPLNVQGEEFTKTRSMVLRGTPGYMSPEQIQAQPLDFRSDIYSLGIVFHEMLTGKQPYFGSLVEVLSHHLYSPIPDLPEAAKGIRTLLQSMTAKDPMKRPASYLELTERIDSLLSAQNLSEESYPSKKVCDRVPTTLEEAKSRRQKARLSSRKRNPLDSIAVLPFTNIGRDPETEYFSDGITESLLNCLSQLPRIRVIPRNTVFRFKGMEQDAQKIGEKLQVRLLLTGRVLHRGHTIDIQTELVDVTNHSQLWGQRFHRELDDMFSVEEEIAREIADKLSFRLTKKEQKRLIKRFTRNVEAYQDYMKGRYYSSRRTVDGLRKGIKCFTQAIQKDTDYALAFAGLADCYNLLGVYEFLPPRESFPAAKEAALRAVQLDDSLAEAHASLASVERNYEWNADLAEKEFKLAIERNPCYATAHHWYGEFLTSQKRMQEGLAEVKRAVDLDSVSSVIRTALGRQYYYMREYDRAIEEYRKILEMDPDFILARFALGFAYIQKSQLEQAATELQKSLAVAPNHPGILASLGLMLALSGKLTECTSILQQLQDLSIAMHVSPVCFAVVSVGLGNHDQAIQWLEKAYQARSVWLVSLSIEPTFDSLRSDARFVRLMQRIGLP